MCLPGTIEAVREQNEGVSRRALLAGGGAAALAVALPGTAEAKRGRRRRGHGHHGGHGRFGKVTDLTHTFRAGFPVYTGDEPTRRTLKNYDPDGFYSQEWTFGEHSGTHMDAPGHFFRPPARRVDELDPQELLAPAAVIDITSRAASNADAEVTPDDIRGYERRYGKLPRGVVVFMNSGWAARVNDNDAFKNTGADGLYHFPGFGIEAVEFLLTKRKINGIGVDTLSLDPGNSTTFAVHNRLLGADRYGIENVANLSNLRPAGALVSVGVVPWEEGSGGPMRLLAYG